jgi:hypothetical protein
MEPGRKLEQANVKTNSRADRITVIFYVALSERTIQSPKENRGARIKNEYKMITLRQRNGIYPDGPRGCWIFFQLFHSTESSSLWYFPAGM